MDERKREKLETIGLVLMTLVILFVLFFAPPFVLEKVYSKNLSVPDLNDNEKKSWATNLIIEKRIEDYSKELKVDIDLRMSFSDIELEQINDYDYAFKAKVIEYINYNGIEIEFPGVVLSTVHFGEKFTFIKGIKMINNL